MSVRYGDAIVAGSMLVDATPTQGSNRPVSSGGVFDACANIDASNFTTTGTTFLSAQGMPGTYRESLTILASGSEYTAPANGYWSFHGTLAASSNTNNQILMYERDFLEGNNLTIRLTGNSYQTSFCGILPARAGSKVVVIYASTATNPNWLFFFHYAVGNQGGQ